MTGPIRPTPPDMKTTQYVRQEKAIALASHRSETS
jgi:hypothetical protein